jgi:hypothetical protein
MFSMVVFETCDIFNVVFEKFEGDPGCNINPLCVSYRTWLSKRSHFRDNQLTNG